MTAKSPRRLSGRSVEGQARQKHRVKIADLYLTGKRTIQSLADEHQVSIYTIRDWVRDRRDAFVIDHRQRPADVDTKRVIQSDAAITVGMYSSGGAMSDDGVRRATRDLEKAIVAGLKARGFAPLPYRKEIEA